MTLSVTQIESCGGHQVLRPPAKEGAKGRGWLCDLLKSIGKKLVMEKKEEQDSSDLEGDGQDDIISDGGWGWVVCFGSFLVNFILDGTMFSFGVLLLELLDHFDEGKSKTAWVGSSLLGMSMFMGPVVSLLLERFTCRQVTIAGTILSSSAFAVSIFSPNIEVLIITYGIIGGIGFSMSFISAIIIVGLYFNKKRAIATGIATSGSGLGTFAYAYLTNYLLDAYGWRGTILVIGGILLNCAVCGALFRPLEFLKSKNREKVIRPPPPKPTVPELGHLLPRSGKQLDPVTYLKMTELPSRLSVSTGHVGKDVTTSEARCDVKHFISQNDLGNTTHRRMHLSSSGHITRMSRNDIFYSGSLSRLNALPGSGLEVNGNGIGSGQSLDSAQSQPERSCLVQLLASHGELFKDKVFVLLLVCNVTWTVQSIPITYIPDLAVSKDISQAQAAMLISVVGISNILGRLLSGVITDIFRIKSTVTYTTALFTAAVISFLFPWCSTFAELAVCCGVFGLCMATVVSMRTIVLADHLGIARLTRSFGLVALFQGIAFMTNAPLAGYLYETSGSYVLPFTFAGGMYVVSGFTCLAVMCYGNQSNQKTKVTSPLEMCISTGLCADSHCCDPCADPCVDPCNIDHLEEKFKDKSTSAQ